MTKRNFHYLIQAAWLFLAIFPLILYLVQIRAQQSVSFYEMMTESNYLAFFVTEDNVIYETIEGAFGTSGILPILSTNMCAYLGYYISVHLAQLIVEVLLFLPKLAIGWLTKFTEKNC